MTRQNLDLGTYANDGTGDTLRQAGQKVNDNFIELFQKLGNDSNVLDGAISVAGGGLSFEGSSVNDFETVLNVVDPTADRSITLPDASGSIVLDTATQVLTNKTLTSPVLTSLSINDASSTHQYQMVVSELAANTNVRLPILTDSDTFIFGSASQDISNKTISLTTLISPRVENQIADENGTPAITIVPTALASNNIKVANSTAGNSPLINVDGGESNINLKLGGKGYGTAELAKASFTVSNQTSNGATSETATYISCNKATQLFLTLSDGTVAGEYKIYTNKGAGDVTVTPTSFAQGISFTLVQNTGCQVIWDGSSWFLIGNQSSVTIL